MRRYYIVSRILLILPIIDFAVAAPVLVQEKRQAGVVAMHIPGDSITMMGKRGDEFELYQLASKLQGLDKYLGLFEDDFALPEEQSATHASSSSAPLGPNHGSTNVEPAPAPNSASSAANPDHTGSDDDSHSTLSTPHQPSPHASPPTEFNSDDGSVAHPPSPHAGSPTEPEHEVVTSPSPNLGPPKEPEHEVIHGSAPSSESTDPELHLDHPSSSAGSRPVDPQADEYAWQRKAKRSLKSRRVSSTARDVGNAAQRKLQPAERSLDPKDLTVRNPGDF